MTEFSYTQKVLLWLNYNWTYICDMANVTEPGYIHGNTLTVLVQYTDMIRVFHNVENIRRSVSIFMGVDMQIQLRAKIN